MAVKPLSRGCAVGVPMVLVNVFLLKSKNQAISFEVAPFYGRHVAGVSEAPIGHLQHVLVMFSSQ